MDFQEKSLFEMIAFLILGLAGSNRYNKIGYVNCDVDFRHVFVASNVRTTKPERGTFFIPALPISPLYVYWVETIS